MHSLLTPDVADPIRMVAASAQLGRLIGAAPAIHVDSLNR
jgi:hypothetical protein